MITAVDTNVLLDILDPDPRFGPVSAAALRLYHADGGLVACEVVWAETAARFARPEDASDVLAHLRVAYSSTEVTAATRAAESWRSYRAAGGSRERMVADFLIGAHALTQADRLLTRDRGFYRKYFGELAILDPTA